MSQDVVINRVVELAEPILEEQGLELVDIEFFSQGSEWLLRLFIDKPGGVNLDDCADCSRELSMILDVEEVIDTAYRLEVSSPGIDRPLKKESDFERFKGELVRAKTRQSVDPDLRGYARKTFIGELIGLVDGVVIIEQNDKAGGQVKFPLDSLETINLEPQF
nr:ribosome maturation factor [uncultured Desulfuromonas sp.]